MSRHPRCFRFAILLMLLWAMPQASPTRGQVPDELEQASAQEILVTLQADRYAQTQLEMGEEFGDRSLQQLWEAADETDAQWEPTIESLAARLSLPVSVSGDLVAGLLLEWTTTEERYNRNQPSDPSRIQEALDLLERCLHHSNAQALAVPRLARLLDLAASRPEGDFAPATERLAGLLTEWNSVYDLELMLQVKSGFRSRWQVVDYELGRTGADPRLLAKLAEWSWDPLPQVAFGAAALEELRAISALTEERSPLLGLVFDALLRARLTDEALEVFRSAPEDERIDSFGPAALSAGRPAYPSSDGVTASLHSTLATLYSLAGDDEAARAQLSAYELEPVEVIKSAEQPYAVITHKSSAVLEAWLGEGDEDPFDALLGLLSETFLPLPVETKLLAARLAERSGYGASASLLYEQVVDSIAEPAPEEQLLAAYPTAGALVLDRYRSLLALADGRRRLLESLARGLASEYGVVLSPDCRPQQQAPNGAGGREIESDTFPLELGSEIRLTRLSTIDPGSFRARQEQLNERQKQKEPKESRPAVLSHSLALETILEVEGGGYSIASGPVPGGLGSGYWLVPWQAQGGVEAAYTGLAFGPGRPFELHPASRQARIRGRTLEMLVERRWWGADGERADLYRLELPLDRILADQDRDGLTDLVEELLLLDPTSRDSDGDGEGDGTDVFPFNDTSQGEGGRDELLTAVVERLEESIERQSPWLPRLIAGPGLEPEHLLDGGRWIVLPREEACRALRSGRRFDVIQLVERHRDGSRAIVRASDRLGLHTAELIHREGRWEWREP